MNEKKFAIKMVQEKWEKVLKDTKKEIRCEEVDFGNDCYRVKFVSHEGKITIPNIPKEWVEEPDRLRSLIKRVEREIKKRRKS
jgi:hypothetical protein